MNRRKETHQLRFAEKVFGMSRLSLNGKFERTTKTALGEKGFRWEAIKPLSVSDLVSMRPDYFNLLHPQIAKSLTEPAPQTEIAYLPVAPYKEVLGRSGYDMQTGAFLDQQHALTVPKEITGAFAFLASASAWIQIDQEYFERTKTPLLAGLYVRCVEELGDRAVVVGRFRDSQKLEIDLWPKSASYQHVYPGTVLFPCQPQGDK